MPTITVKKGDTVWALTRRELEKTLGRKPTNQEISKVVNKVDVPSGDRNLIRPGEKVFIPSGSSGSDSKGKSPRDIDRERGGSKDSSSKSTDSSKKKPSGTGAKVAAGVAVGAAAGAAAARKRSKTKAVTARAASARNVSDLRSRIRGASSMDELNAVAAEIKNANLDADVRDSLRSDWKDRRAAINKPKFTSTPKNRASGGRSNRIPMGPGRGSPARQAPQNRPASRASRVAAARQAIKDASTREELAAVGRRIARSDFPEGAKNDLRARYRERQDAMKPKELPSGQAQEDAKPARARKEPVKRTAPAKKTAAKKATTTRKAATEKKSATARKSTGTRKSTAASTASSRRAPKNPPKNTPKRGVVQQVIELAEDLVSDPRTQRAARAAARVAR